MLSLSLSSYALTKRLVAFDRIPFVPLAISLARFDNIVFLDLVSRHYLDSSVVSKHPFIVILTLLYGYAKGLTVFSSAGFQISPFLSIAGNFFLM